MATFDSEQKSYQDTLSKWENFLGLPKTEPQRTEVDFILNVNISEIRKIPTVQLSEYSFVLMQYAFFLQQKSNECQTFIKWTEHVANRLQGDCVARALSTRRKVEMRLSRIGYLARRIEMVAQSINNISRTRYSEGKAHESN